MTAIQLLDHKKDFLQWDWDLYKPPCNLRSWKVKWIYIKIKNLSKKSEGITMLMFRSTHKNSPNLEVPKIEKRSNN